MPLSCASSRLVGGVDLLHPLLLPHLLARNRGIGCNCKKANPQLSLAAPHCRSIESLSLMAGVYNMFAIPFLLLTQYRYASPLQITANTTSNKTVALQQ
jgi:hypothetical protein